MVDISNAVHTHYIFIYDPSKYIDLMLVDHYGNMAMFLLSK